MNGSDRVYFQKNAEKGHFLLNYPPFIPRLVGVYFLIRTVKNMRKLL